MSQAKIIYSGFYDVPLAFVVWHQGNQYLFVRDFDDDLDDYPEEYKVFVLPALSNDEIEKSWQNLEERATRYLGDIPVMKVSFDPTKRKEIDTSVIEQLLAETG